MAGVRFADSEIAVRGPGVPVSGQGLGGGFFGLIAVVEKWVDEGLLLAAG